MKDGICSKCGSSNVYRGPVGWVATGWAFKDSALLPMTMMSGAVLTNYVCTACGYVERYVESPTDKNTIAENWEKVESRGANS
jgi:predicted nucleic-acid-binding Zn-ribbon protein